VNRRSLITLLGAAAAVWPLAARAQPGERTRRIGVLMYLAADDAHGQARLAAFTQALKQLGWSDGRNLRIDTRSTARHYAAAGGLIICFLRQRLRIWRPFPRRFDSWIWIASGPFDILSHASLYCDHCELSSPRRPYVPWESSTIVNPILPPASEEKKD
jgi:hypothetical protein